MSPTTLSPTREMLQLIPAIDLIGGLCVRLTAGDFARQTTYSAEPVAVAKAFEQAGTRRLHLVDLDGAKSGTVAHWDTLESICKQTSLQVDFSGGLKSEEDLQRAFDAGAAYVVIGSMAVKQPDVVASWLQRFGADRVILSADTRDGQVAIHGWQESAELSIYDFLAEWVARGIRSAIVTDIAKDGLLQGPSTSLYEHITAQLPELKLIASGGVRGVQDLRLLDNLGLHGAIVGKALYEGSLKLEDAKRYLGPIE